MHVTIVVLFFVISSGAPVLGNESAPGVKNHLSGDRTDVKIKGRDLDLVISAASVLARMGNNEDIDLVDVRAPKDFRQFRIPGSLNIPLHAVKTKGFLRSRSVALVNEGYGYSELEKGCKGLRNSGFSNVRILEGGLNYWQAAGGTIEGDFFAWEKMNEIPPQEFFVDKAYDDWLVIDTSESVDPEAAQLIPFAISIPYLKGSKDFVAQIEKEVARLDGDSLPYILIFNEQGLHYKSLRKSVKNAGIENVFFLRGGLNAYRAFMANPARTRQQKQKKMEKCRTCP